VARSVRSSCAQCRHVHTHTLRHTCACTYADYIYARMQHVRGGRTVSLGGWVHSHSDGQHRQQRVVERWCLRAMSSCLLMHDTHTGACTQPQSACCPISSCRTHMRRARTYGPQEIRTGTHPGVHTHTHTLKASTPPQDKHLLQVLLPRAVSQRLRPQLFVAGFSLHSACQRQQACQPPDSPCSSHDARVHVHVRVCDHLCDVCDK